MTSEFVVTADFLNLRSSPELTPDNIKAKLPRSHVVTVLDTSNSPMWKVRTQLLDTQFEGFVSRKFLQPRQAPGPTGSSLKAIIDNGTELSFAELKPLKSLVNEIQQRLSRLGFYPGGRMIDGQLGQLNSWTWKGLKEFCSAFQLPMVSEAKAFDPVLAQALLDKRQATVVFDRARDVKAIAKQIAAIQEAGVPASGVNPPAPPARRSRGGGAPLRRSAPRLALQGVGRPVSLVRGPPQPDEPCPGPILPHLNWPRYSMAAAPGS